jgi:2'-5' RNA ligase
VTAPAAAAADLLEPGEGGDPAESQPCQLGSEAAIRSLIFRDGEAYAPTCEEHDAHLRGMLEGAGETVSDVVEIPAADPVTAAGEAPEIVGPEQDGEIPLRFPVLVIEAQDTSDGRFLKAGSLTHRALPIPLLALPESAHGGNDPGAAGIVGRIDTLTRTPGPEVTSPSTGEPFPEGTFVWSGTGVLSSTAKVGAFDVADLFRRRFLRGISVDLAGMDYEVIGEEGGMAADPEHPRRQMIAHAAQISAATLVAIPAFADAYAEVATDTGAASPANLDELPEGLAASAFPAWRSAEVGDYPALVAAGDEPHTGGMVALIPSEQSANDLLVNGGEPLEELHLTLAYLGEDVTAWDPEQRTAVLDHVRGWAQATPPIDADAMGWALFNPTGANDREPCAVYLISGDGLPAAKGAMGDFETSEHAVFLPHITAGYGLKVDALSFIGPVTFTKVRVALGQDVTDFELGERMGGPSDDPEPSDWQKEEGAMAAADTPLAEDPGPIPNDLMETGLPDTAQPCAFCGIPATHSLLFADGEQYVPACDDDDQTARDAIAAEGGEVTGEVPIVTADDQPEEGA